MNQNRTRTRATRCQHQSNQTPTTTTAAAVTTTTTATKTLMKQKESTGRCARWRRTNCSGPQRQHDKDWRTSREPTHVAGGDGWHRVRRVQQVTPCTAGPHRVQRVKLVTSRPARKAGDIASQLCGWQRHAPE